MVDDLDRFIDMAKELGALDAKAIKADTLLCSSFER